ncbi:hypothetical protein GCAAIG_10240 [Candidatus Electronema halotolerans]
MPQEMLLEIPELKEKQTVMDMQLISNALTAAAAWLGLIDKQGWRIGGIAGAAVIVAAIVLAIILKKKAKKDKKENEPSVGKNIGNGATTEGKMEFEDIEQKGSRTQSVGKGAKAGKGMSFKKIRQE